MAAELSGILDVLETDDDFRALISGEVEEPESDIDPSITVGVPEGLRPALAAGAAGSRPVVLVVASGGRRRRRSRRFVPGTVATRRMWPSWRLGKRCLMNVCLPVPIRWPAAWRCSAG